MKKYFLPQHVTMALNFLIPKCAVLVDVNHTKCLWYLHPRKGWKRVSLKRLGAA